MSRDQCRKVQASLYEYLDWELSLPEEAAVELHLVDCRDCRERFRFEGELLSVVRQRCGAIRAPRRLRRQIAALIGQM
jgi:mycothiol system anti-sigma-R factor